MCMYIYIYIYTSYVKNVACAVYLCSATRGLAAGRTAKRCLRRGDLSGKRKPPRLVYSFLKL